MESIDILHPINTELLSPKYYFQSLIEQACYCGLLSDKGLSAIQTDLLLILAEQMFIIVLPFQTASRAFSNYTVHNLLLMRYT